MDSLGGVFVLLILLMVVIITVARTVRVIQQCLSSTPWS